MSPSMRREWIEIGKDNVGILHKVRSPSMRREWIEIIFPFGLFLSIHVSLHAEGVD